MIVHDSEGPISMSMDSLPMKPLIPANCIPSARIVLKKWKNDLPKMVET